MFYKGQKIDLMTGLQNCTRYTNKSTITSAAGKNIIKTCQLCEPAGIYFTAAVKNTSHLTLVCEILLPVVEILADMKDEMAKAERILDIVVHGVEQTLSCNFKAVFYGINHLTAAGSTIPFTLYH